MSTIKRIISQLAGLTYGLLSFSVLGARAVVEGYIIKRPGSAFWKAVENTRNEYWTLSKHPNGFKHALYTLKNGRILHYVTATKDETGKRSANLVLFLHGWPDSWMLWSTVMRKTILNSEDTCLVALDLPGYGGSDSLDKHDATQVLEAVTEFVLDMRAQYIDAEKESTVLLVAHDWGAVCGFKLASQAPQLADRFILMNSTLPELAIENISNRVRFATQMFPKWLRQPTHLSLLRSINVTVAPVVTQLIKSSYIFIFNLPGPLPALFGQLGGNWFVRYAHFLASGSLNAPTSPEAVLHMASSLGPNKTCCSSGTTDGAQGYGRKVAARADIGAWYSGCRYYSEGVASEPWDKSLETIMGLHNLREKTRRSSSGAGIFDEKPGRLKVPTTVLWGEKDPALQSNIMLEGIKDYFVHGSQVVALPKHGHWVPLEEGGADAIARVIIWALNREKNSIEESLQGLDTEFKVTIEK